MYASDLEATVQNGNADDPADMSDELFVEDVPGGGAGGEGRGVKRPLDPLVDTDENVLETVRNIRRRLALEPLGGGSGKGGNGGVGDATGTPDGREGSPAVSGGGGEGAGGGDGKGKGRAKMEITNADLAELLRSTKPRGNRRGWARVLYRAQNTLQGTHAGGKAKGAAR